MEAHKESSMTSEELLRRVRQIELGTKRWVDALISGGFKSHFKGQGIQFTEHRVYVAGDDVRHIDWKVSARSKDLLIKKFEEDRELQVLILVDFSKSETVGSKRISKHDAMVDLFATLAFSAMKAGDRVGAIFFTDRVEKIIKPKKGKSHFLRMIRDFLAFSPKNSGTNIASACESARRLMTHSGVVFVLSDFLDPNYNNELRSVAFKNDVLAIRVTDKLEKSLPQGLYLRALGAESGQEYWFNLTDQKVKEWLRKIQTKWFQELDDQLKTSRIETLQVTTEEDYVEAVVRYFRSRRRHIRG